MFPSLYADVHAMKHPNLARRGHLFWWRRKVTINGATIPIDLSLRTANFYQARAIADRLGSVLEGVRMAYGECGSAVDSATLKRIFQDAMRWQLERILQSQVGSTEPIAAHRETNRVYAEFWRHHASRGADATWSEDDQARLIRAGWSPDDVEMLMGEANRHSGRLVSLRQLQVYANHFGFQLTPANENRVQQVVLSARAAACDAADHELGNEPGDLRHWVEDALAATHPLVFDEPPRTAPAPTEADPPAQQDRPPLATLSPDSGLAQESAAIDERRKPAKLLIEAKKECIAAYKAEQAWSSDSIEQVRTAIRLFDFACGGKVAVEAINKGHVAAFKDLCDALPNRWGRTREEQAGGMQASLDRAKTMDASKLGMARPTRNKHLTWISSVLAFAASDQGGNHEPADPASVEKAIREVRRGVGKKGGKSDRKRARDLRAAWTKDEIARLLSAPIWSGCENLDERLAPGSEIYHDAWYWAPLMMVLYGGRSSEIVALPLADTHESEPIPFFGIDYTDLRALKTVQSVRQLPLHPELIRLGFIDYVVAMRSTGHELLFPELHSPASKSFASTFYKSVFQKWRSWAFPTGTSWRHQVRGAMKDKDVHSFRGTASSMMKGKIQDSVRIDILGHEGETETTRTYDEEAALEDKLRALEILTPLTTHITARPLRLRPPERQKFGARRGRAKSSTPG